MILEEHRGSYGMFEPNVYVSGVSDLNKYVPFYVNSTNDGLNYVTNDVYLYNKPEKKDTWSIKTYPDFLKYVKQSLSLRKFKYVLEGVEELLYFMQGYIADKEDNILLLLTVKNNFMFNSVDITLDKDSFRLYISTKFIKNPIYKNFYKKLQKEYIDRFLEEDIEVVYTTSEKIHNSVFKDGFEINYNSLTELTELLHTEPAEILNFNEEDGYIPPPTERYSLDIDPYIPEVNEVRMLPLDTSTIDEIIAEMDSTLFYVDPVQSVNEQEQEDLPF